MAYGLSAAAVGETFPWIFNPPDTYWDGASAILEHIGEQEGGLDKLQGKKIGFIYLDAGYGREPIPLLEAHGRRSTASSWSSIRSLPTRCRTRARSGSTSAATGRTTW